MPVSACRYRRRDVIRAKTSWRRRAGDTAAHCHDQFLGNIASTCISGYELIINQPAEFDGLKERLAKHGLEMRSLYVNSLLHGEANSDASIEQVLAIAAREVDDGGGIIAKSGLVAWDLSRVG